MVEKPTKTPKKRGGCLRFVLFLFKLTLIGLLAGILVTIAGYYYLSQQLASDIERVVNYAGSGLGGTPRYFDRNGQLLWEAVPVEQRQWLPYDQIPVNVINATIAVEDDTFWDNPGFDPAALLAAIISNSRNEGRPVGGSTITQQLVRHIAFTYEQRVATSYERKAREIFYAFILTRQRSKSEIMAMYLNEIYYGNLTYGIEAASQTYFGKPATELRLEEAAFLAGIPQSPVDWNPYANFAGTKTRQEIILDLMAEDGLIDPQTAQTAKETPLLIQPFISPNQRASQAHLEAPHFILYVQDELERRYGAEQINRNGWQITTSLDLNIQYLAEERARTHVQKRAEQHNVTNSAVMVMKPSSGEILAMVGSLDYFNTDISGQFNMTLVPRQPGSSFKPITYVTAMQKGWTTGDVLWDVPIVLDLGGGQFMRPTNYDGRFHGPVLFRDALANSYNIPPIQLLRDVGISSVVATSRAMGISSLEQQTGYYGLALTLGGGEVPLLEMTQAYATLANGGKRPHPLSILRIVDSAGNVVFDTQTNLIPPNNSIDPRIAYIINDILSDNNARTPAMGANSALNLPFPAAVKTGTTNDYRDNWTIGYTPSVVVGVWSGNTDGQAMRDSSGLFGAAPIWHEIMVGIYGHEELLESLQVNGELPAGEFALPAGIETRDVCLPRGTGGTKCSASRGDLFISGGPAHSVARLGYTPDKRTMAGTWAVTVAGLPGSSAETVWAGMPALADGTRPPLPTQCVINGNRPNLEKRLLLPVPPFYPDEVRARNWANLHGYKMAPSVSCPLAITQNLSRNGGNGSNGDSLPSSSTVQVTITSPQAGQMINRGGIPVWGSLQFDPAGVQSVWLEYGTNGSWRRFGNSFTQPVGVRLLGELPGDGLNAGNYMIRVLVAGKDGAVSVAHTVSFQLK